MILQNISINLCDLSLTNLDKILQDSETPDGFDLNVEMKNIKTNIEMLKFIIENNQWTPNTLLDKLKLNFQDSSFFKERL
jgi:hypothetical protein